MLDSVTLLGSSSGRNAGDAGLLAAIMDSCDRNCGSPLLYEIPTIRPEFIWQNYKNRVRPVSILPWDLSVKLLGLPTYRSVLRTDLSLVFDAVLFDRALFNPLFNFLSSLYVLLPRAKKAGKKLGFFNVTAGPVTTPLGRKMLVELAEMMDFITVRDQDSFDIFRDLGVKNPNMIATADSALSTKPASDERIDEIWRTIGIDPAAEDVLALNICAYIDSWAGVNREPMSKERFIASYVSAVNQIVKQVQAPLLFASTQHLDESMTREIMARVNSPKKKVLLSNKVYNHHEIKGVLGRAGLLVGMRLHCMILGSSACCPIVALSYLPKVRHYMRSLGIDEHCMDFDDFSESLLVKGVLAGWEKRKQLRAHLEAKIPVLQREADKAGQIVAAIHRGEDIGVTMKRLSA